MDTSGTSQIRIKAVTEILKSDSMALSIVLVPQHITMASTNSHTSSLSIYQVKATVSVEHW